MLCEKLIATGEDDLQYVNYFCSLTANYAGCTGEIESRIAMAKAALNKRKGSFHQHIGLNSKEGTSEMLYLERRFVWC